MPLIGPRLRLSQTAPRQLSSLSVGQETLDGFKVTFQYMILFAKPTWLPEVIWRFSVQEQAWVAK